MPEVHFKTQFFNRQSPKKKEFLQILQKSSAEIEQFAIFCYDRAKKL